MMVIGASKKPSLNRVHRSELVISKWKEIGARVARNATFFEVNLLCPSRVAPIERIM